MPDNMEPIIEPVSLELIKSQLTPERKLCNSNKGGNEIYVIDGKCAPDVLREVGRLREICFRDAGGATGLPLDLDRFDTMEVPYSQIVVWDPDAEAIIGGYRFILGTDVALREDGQPDLASSHQFHFSQEFITHYLPHTIELGRSFVTPEYQSSKAGAKAIFAMDNLWDGITAIVMKHPQMMYLFGKVTMYSSFDPLCRDIINYFLWKHFPDPDCLVRPHTPVEIKSDTRLISLVLRQSDFKEDYKCLKDAIRTLGCNIPPLVNSYMNLSPTMRMFGTAVNEEMPGIEDSGILVCFNEMYEEKKERHIKAIFADTIAKARQRFPQLESGFEEKLKARWKERRAKPFAKFRARFK